MSPEVEQKKVSVIVVMGVSGAGKSTIAALLAARLGWTYEDADWFHPPANLEKMHAGKPLTDEDRWLDISIKVPGVAGSPAALNV